MFTLKTILKFLSSITYACKNSKYFSLWNLKKKLNDKKKRRKLMEIFSDDVKTNFEEKKKKKKKGVVVFKVHLECY